MLEFPRKERGERKKKLKEGEEGKESKREWKGGGRNKDGKVKGWNEVVYWERRRKCVKRNKVHSLLPGRKIFFASCKMPFL